MISALIAWLVLSYYLASDTTTVKKETSSPKIKTERSESEKYEPSLLEGLSDTSRTFPAHGRHKPLRFTGREQDVGRGSDERVKQENEVIQSTGLQPLTPEADDEDEEIETPGFRDSGIGTSLDESQRARVQRRKKGSLLGDLPENQ